MARPDESKPPLTRRLAPGMRVVLRTRAEGGRTVDVVGELREVGPEQVTVATRRGEVQVRRADVLTGKQVPPPAVRRGRPHRAIGLEDLQRMAAAAHPPLTQRALGGWLLRAAEGYTARANSVLALGHPDRDVDAAVGEARAWARQHDVPLWFQISGPPGFDPVADADLPGAWTAQGRVLVLTAATADVAAAAGPAPAARVSTDLDEGWLHAAEERERAHADLLRRMLAAVPDQRFVTVDDAAGHPVAVGRVALHPGWAGLFSLHVRPDVRRHGRGRGLVALAADQARQAGAGSLYLQVAADNAPAVTLYERLGFTLHHEYWYLEER